MQSPSKYPIGIQSFSEIRNNGYIYVDKTDYLRKLLELGSKYAFLSRPRRFGKSLFVSMTEEFFKGNRSLFKGLAIDNYGWEWFEHPVIHFDLSGCPSYSDDSMVEFIGDTLSRYEKDYGITTDSSKQIGLRFKEIIIEAHRQTDMQVAILIDEYDKPLLDSVDNQDRQEVYRQQLRSLYGNLKSQDNHIKFAMLTGVTKFGHLSIFSDLNNLEDISMTDDYSGICGITSDELHEYFDNGVENLAERLKISKNEAYDLLRCNYDGYHFAPENAPDIYNPFSIINALKNRRISNYWFQTGTPSFLVKTIKNQGISLQSLGDIDVDVDSIASISFDFSSSLYPLLYQSGYLTIKGYRPEVNSVRLGFPNKEVEQGFYNQLMKVYIPAADRGTPFSILQFYDDIIEGNADSFMTRLQSLLSDFNQDGFSHIEIEQHYQDVIYLVMKLLGFFTHIEYKTASGRIDLVVKTPKYIYVFEFKMNKTAREALEQIHSKDYLLPFKADGRRLVKIGANFSDKTHCFSDWIIEQ